MGTSGVPVSLWFGGPAAGRITTGTYIATGAGSVPVNVGFSPKHLFVTHLSDNGGTKVFIKNSAMPGDDCVTILPDITAVASITTSASLAITKRGFAAKSLANTTGTHYWTAWG